jgi:hypothetical protein
MPVACRDLPKVVKDFDGHDFTTSAFMPHKQRAMYAAKWNEWWYHVGGMDFDNFVPGGGGTLLYVLMYVSWWSRCESSNTVKFLQACLSIIEKFDDQKPATWELCK